jgi:glycosyltransferase involved in cell wall biosynthesis
MLYAGKLDTNKGAQLLPRALHKAGVQLPLAVAGDGPLRGQIEAEATSLGLDFRFYAWLDNDAVIKLMRDAKVLLFPSAWQEPLSRVLLEGCAAGAAIVALDTGGTGDIISHNGSGWLARDMDEFVEGVRAVVSDVELNGRLREGALRRAEERFAAPIVTARVEELYRRLLTEAIGA